MTASSNEYRILSLMWKVKHPITRADILKGTTGRTWNPASIHLILNSMISKGFIKITDEEKTYGRTYEPNLTYEQYVIGILTEAIPDKDIKEILADCAKMYDNM